ncbi:hypothetical protein NUSPORA_00785 [Nucleospora cyclopteri]
MENKKKKNKRTSLLNKLVIVINIFNISSFLLLNILNYFSLIYDIVYFTITMYNISFRPGI